jgi:SAM-dependent methyltransferase
MSRIDRLLDIADYAACRIGLSHFPKWEEALAGPKVNLYAGKVSRGLPQFATHWGITPYYASSRNVCHDVTMPYPIPDQSVDCYQSEDVFEHIPLARIVPIIDEIHRVLKPGGLFRLSVPDYHFDLYRDRTRRGADGQFLFDPGGGGNFRDGQVVDGGHLWFPTIELMRELMGQSRFAGGGRIEYLHYTEADGSFTIRPIDYSLGHIQRTPDHDARVADNPRPLSIVIDAWKLEN